MMMNKYLWMITGIGCLLAAACQADTVRTEAVRNIPAAAAVQAKSAADPAGHRNEGVQEHRRFKRLSLPLR